MTSKKNPNYFHERSQIGKNSLKEMIIINVTKPTMAEVGPFSYFHRSGRKFAFHVFGGKNIFYWLCNFSFQANL